MCSYEDPLLSDLESPKRSDRSMADTRRTSVSSPSLRDRFRASWSWHRAPTKPPGQTHRHKPKILPGSKRRPPFSQPAQTLAPIAVGPRQSKVTQMRTISGMFLSCTTHAMAGVYLHTERCMVVAVSSLEVLQRFCVAAQTVLVILWLVRSDVVDGLCRYTPTQRMW